VGRVTKPIGSSSKSWQTAADEALKRANKTLRVQSNLAREGAMSTRLTAGLIVWAWVTVMQTGNFPAAAAADMSNLRVVSEQAAGGFAFPESVAYDPDAKVLYVSQFGGTEPKPAEKDGKGKISKVSVSGKILEEQFLPTPGETLNKHKGIWVKGDMLWVTDIDVVWVFVLKTL
jgi:flavin-binding protein dodecin